MKKFYFVLAIAILLAGSAVGIMPGPSYAQGYEDYYYAPPPQDPHSTPWVGSNTPWTYYQGDWFLNGILHNFFGNQYGWAPYYAYPTTYIVRPTTWYEPRWNTWYQGHPHYWTNFHRQYPYWRGHHAGQHYDQNFYNAHHRGQGGGWNQGFHGVRPPGATGPGGHTPGTTGAAVRPPGGHLGEGPGKTPPAPGGGVRPPKGYEPPAARSGSQPSGFGIRPAQTGPKSSQPSMPAPGGGMQGQKVGGMQGQKVQPQQPHPPAPKSGGVKAAPAPQQKQEKKPEKKP